MCIYFVMKRGVCCANVGVLLASQVASSMTIPRDATVLFKGSFPKTSPTGVAPLSCQVHRCRVACLAEPRVLLFGFRRRGATVFDLCGRACAFGFVGCSCRWASMDGAVISSRAMPPSMWAITAGRVRLLGPWASGGAMLSIRTRAWPTTRTGTGKTLSIGECER